MSAVLDRKRLSESEAAEYIGMSISWLSKSRLPGREDAPPWLKIGRRVVYDSAELDAWLAAHRMSTPHDIGWQAPAEGGVS